MIARASRRFITGPLEQVGIAPTMLAARLGIPDRGRGCAVIAQGPEWRGRDHAIYGLVWQLLQAFSGILTVNLVYR